jgi:histidinol-phosphate aminotransferase
MVRDAILAMAGYAPGEQPQDQGYIKLNTNENAYPPSPRVFEAIRAGLTGDRLRKYPDPTGRAFREAAARLHGVSPDAILIGNGSDEVLTILIRTLVPEGGRVSAVTPTYLLYRTLAEIQGAEFVAVAFGPDWSLPAPWPDVAADVTFVANPNSPSGTQVSREALERLRGEVGGPLVVDEAYIDFSDPESVSMAGRPGVIVTRTLSKAYSLAGLRVGYAIAEPDLVREMNKVKDSYNCDALSLLGAAAALEDQDYHADIRQRIIATRGRFTAELERLGFVVTPSRANFVWCHHPDRDARAIYEALKARKILVRLMASPQTGTGLRITVGLDSEIDRLLEELKPLVGQ